MKTLAAIWILMFWKKKYGMERGRSFCLLLANRCIGKTKVRTMSMYHAQITFSRRCQQNVYTLFEIHVKIEHLKSQSYNAV